MVASTKKTMAAFFLPVLFTTSLTMSVPSTAVKYAKGSQAACEALRTSIKLKDTTVTNVTYLPGSQNFNIPGAHATCSQSATASAALCRVQLTVKTSSSSQVKMEIWLPDEWEGRVASVGNGGLNGCIDYSNLDYLSSLSFAVAGSNNGHDGMTGVPFLNSPEVIKDFAYRAIHVETVTSKAVTAQYYKRKHHHSYYVGCSTGGRQGFRAIQDFPEDFDGVLAGAPAIDFNHLIAWSGALSINSGAPQGTSSPKYLKPALWEVVRAAAVKHCDKIDGVEDGVIDDPDLCDFDPAVLLCDASGSNTTNCLTEQQVEAVRKTFTPVYNAEGTLVYPRFDPGAPHTPMMFGGNFFTYSLDWYKYTVYNNTNWEPSAWGNQTIADADAINPGGISTWKPDMSAFQKRGGKVITYHGRQDGLIASGNSIRWFQTVKSTMGATSMNKFYRFFSIPGMDHCQGGIGAVSFGQRGGAQQGVPEDAEHNAVLSLVEWVEAGKAPAEIIGSQVNASGEKIGERRFCAYPKKSVSTKLVKGKREEAGEWVCIE